MQVYATTERTLKLHETKRGSPLLCGFCREPIKEGDLVLGVFTVKN
jgi:hypothetical protein